MIDHLLKIKKSGLNLRFLVYFLLFAYVPLTIFSVVGYFLNRRILKQIYLQDQKRYVQVWENNYRRILKSEKAFYSTLINNLKDPTLLFSESSANQFLISKPLALFEENRLRVSISEDKLVLQQLQEAFSAKSDLYFNFKRTDFWLRLQLNKNLTLLVTYPIHQLLDISFSQQPDARISLISEKDKLIISKQKIRVFEKSGIQNWQNFINALKNNENWLTVIDTFEPGWQVVFQRNTNTIFLPLKKFLIQIIFANFAIGILLLIFAIFTAQSITNPIRILAEAAKRISHGHLDEPFPIRGKDEIRQLAIEFETMRQKLLESYQNLEKKIEERTRALKEAQFQISHQEKMASIGLLAAGIAHEIGNPLTSISSMTQIIKRKINDENVEQYLTTIRQNIDRISRIVRELVDFARPSNLEATWVNINDVIRNAHGIIKYDKRAKAVDFQIQLQENLPNLYLVPDQLLQVILNILINALDALNQGKGKIEISSQQENDDILISITDNGVGIPEENLSKIFEPFFTTKDVGRGTGLGLSVSYGIIKNFGGTIIVKSRVGKGSTFTIKLPVQPNLENMNES